MFQVLFAYKWYVLRDVRTDYDVYAVHENIDVLPYGSATHTGVHMYLQEVAQGLDHLHIH